VNKLRILGVDPGSIRTGYAIVDFSGQQFQHVHSGFLALGQGAMAPRLGRIFAELTALIAAHRPEVAAVESIFVHKNVSSAIKLGQARGAAISALACADLEVAEYSPATVKQAICGSGRAEKQQINYMVQRLVNLREDLQEDQADALALAVCHAFRQGLSGAVAASRLRPRGTRR
jgi:crossover junction endodeoxyribonuclease RuvC